MDAQDRDDFVHAVGQTLAFYDKELTKMKAGFWVNTCRHKPVHQLKKALLEYPKVGKYAPKPSDILEIVDNMSQQPSGKVELPAPPTTNCPEHIARAWMWFIARISAGSNIPLFQEHGEIDIKTQEKYLHLVNHEAFQNETPEAIPEEFRLREVWG